jgi:tRNA G18 (ribose-2'-O)-methylase SpoU
LQVQGGHVFDARAIGEPGQGGETAGVLVPVEAGDPRLADYVELPDPAARRRIERDELFVVEGLIAITRLLSSGHQVRSLLVTPQALDRLDLDFLDAPVYVASREVLASTVGFDLHRGAVAIAERRPLPSVADAVAGASRIAVLEGLNDPENLGAIARSARAFGIGALVLDPTCIDPYYRRTIRVSMGEVLFLPVARAAAWPGDLTALGSLGFETWALTPDRDAESIWSLDVPSRVAVVLGAEGPGLSRRARTAATRRVRIPIDPGVDSLNVGHAAAIAFAAIAR